MKMLVIVNGKTEEREVSHYQKNPITNMMEEQPIAKPGEIIHRDANGNVYISGGAHR